MMLQILVPLKVLGWVLDVIPVTWLLGAMAVASVLQLGVVPGLHVDLLGMLFGLLGGFVAWGVGLAEAGWNWFLNAVAGAVNPF